MPKADRYPDIVRRAELPALMRIHGLLSVYNYMHDALAEEQK